MSLAKFLHKNFYSVIKENAVKFKNKKAIFSEEGNLTYKKLKDYIFFLSQL